MAIYWNPPRRLIPRIVCWLFGHRPYKNNLFSGRMGICQRCHQLPEV